MNIIECICEKFENKDARYKTICVVYEQFKMFPMET